MSSHEPERPLAVKACINGSCEARMNCRHSREHFPFAWTGDVFNVIDWRECRFYERNTERKQHEESYA